jgi:hypothetical protein
MGVIKDPAGIVGIEEIQGVGGNESVERSIRHRQWKPTVEVEDLGSICPCDDALASKPNHSGADVTAQVGASRGKLVPVQPPSQGSGSATQLEHCIGVLKITRRH